jgi:hypothetical protein
MLRDVNGNATEETSIGVSRRSFIAKVKTHRYSKLEIFLAVLSLLLLVALVVMLVVMEEEKSEDNSTDKKVKIRLGAIQNLARKYCKVDFNTAFLPFIYNY